MPEQLETTATRVWTIEAFKTFWSRPDRALVPRIRDVITADMVGYWPRPIGEVRDPDLYVDVIAAVLETCPDWSLSVPEYARSGNLHLFDGLRPGLARKDLSDSTVAIG